MSINVSIPDKSFDFSNLNLGDPISLGASIFFSKISNGNDIYIQTPEIKCKDGIINNTKKPYIDLLIDRNNEELLEWFETLEQQLNTLIYNKKDEWFQDDNIDLTDIENIFISPIKSFRKQYSLRTYLDNPTSLIHKKDIKIYDEDNNVLQNNDIDSKSKIIVLLHINGLKFSSKNFQVHIDIKEIMKLSNDTTCNFIIKQISKKGKNEKKIDNLEENSMNDNNNIEDENNENMMIQDIKKEELKKETNHEINDDSLHEDKNTHVDDIKILSEEKKDNIEEIKNENTNNFEITNDNNYTTEDLPVNLKEDIKENIKEDIKENIKEDIKEFNVLEELDESNTIKINYPSEEDKEMYRQALQEAKEARKKALDAFLHAKKIKAQYLLNLESESDSDESETELNI